MLNIQKILFELKKMSFFARIRWDETPENKQIKKEATLEVASFVCNLAVFHFV